MQLTLPALVALLLTPQAGLRAADDGKVPARIGQHLIDLPPRHQVWPSDPPKDCPFEQSKTLAGIVFTGAHSDYRAGDTFYPSWASDSNQYSPFTDGVTDGVQSFSFGQQATTGNVVMMGDDPLDLIIKNTAPPQVANPLPYVGRYPAGSLVHNGVWYYGTYCLGPDGFVNHEGFTYNWPVLGPMPGFRISKDYGKTWTPSPLSPKNPLFPEPAKHLGTVKMGAPHFVDFGKNMEHSPDGKAYLLGMGAEENDPKPRYANLSWISADQVYLTRVTPSPETINDLKAYEFFAGHDAAGKPVWTADFAKIKPLLDWNNHMGCVTATYVPGLKKYLMCVTDGWPTTGKMHSYILEADTLTGPWRLVVYMKDFGEQAYFLNFPSKFIAPSGKQMWLCYSANFAAEANGQKLKFNPPGGRYGLCLHEVRLLAPGEKVKEEANPFDAPDNVARQARIETSVTHPDYNAKGATDGKAGGYPDDIKQEWASFGWGEGAWIKLTWDKPQTVSRVWLVDRPNPTDQITGGTIQFSDGSSIETEKPLPDGGAKGLEITFAPKTITSLTFKVTKVKQKPCNIGLSEIAVFAAGAKAVNAADAGAKEKQPKELPPCGVRLTIVEEHPTALIVKGSAGTEGNKHGLEGGRAMKLDGVYHVFTAEMVDEPIWVKMKLGHWTSPDRLTWTRRQTMCESSGEPTGKDPRASLWSPMPVYNEKEGRWNFFYVAYRAQVGPLGWNGRIWRAVSKVKGPAGIDGPWEDVGVILQPGPAGGAWEESVMKGGVPADKILQPGPESDAWEGSQGVDSFFPYPVGDKWLGFYGSCNGHNWFKVGLSEAPELAGPWKRLTAMNPVDLVSTRGPENPVVHRLNSGRYIALFEVVARENGFGYADSRDGFHWTKGSELPLTEAPKRIRKVRTPLGLVPEPDGTFTIFFTGYNRAESWGEMWMVRVKVEELGMN